MVRSMLIVSLNSFFRHSVSVCFLPSRTWTCLQKKKKLRLNMCLNTRSAGKIIKCTWLCISFHVRLNNSIASPIIQNQVKKRSFEDFQQNQVLKISCEHASQIASPVQLCQLQLSKQRRRLRWFYKLVSIEDLPYIFNIHHFLIKYSP